MTPPTAAGPTGALKGKTMANANNRYSRRQILAAGAATGLAATVGGLPTQPWLGPAQALARGAEPRGTAEHCIFIWLGGGMGQIDTLDPKKPGNAEKNEPGSYYKSIPTAVQDVRVCEHMPNIADRLDRMAILRSVHHDEIDEHAAATNRMHTGRPTTGSIVYPSVGSIISYMKGDGGEGVPRYVVVGYPSVSRGPGFLGAEGNYLYLTDTESGPSSLKPGEDVDAQRRSRRRELRRKLREAAVSRAEGDRVLADYDATIEQAEKLTGPQFMNTFNLDNEKSELRESYGGEFGQRCLLARRLVQRGVRFVEVSHNLNFLNGAGWDVHNEGILDQHKLIRELDKAVASLVSDLEDQGLLEKTLVVVSTEFGRPAGFDSRGGRGHYSDAFSVLMAGGGTRGGAVIGETDELAMNIVSRPVSAADLFATKFAALGLDPHHELDSGERPVPISDRGEPVAELFT